MVIIKYHLYCKGYYYYLKELKSKKVIYTTCTFYSMYCFLKNNNFDFNSISIPRLTLRKFFYDFGSFDEEERI